MLEIILISLCLNYTCEIVDEGYINEVRHIIVKTTKVNRQQTIQLLTPSIEFTGKDSMILVVPLKH